MQGAESRKEEALSLSKYLHDLGIILHYQEDAFFKRNSDIITRMGDSSII